MTTTNPWFIKTSIVLLIVASPCVYAKKRPKAPPVSFPTDIRSVDGTNNNLANPAWGSVDQTFLRALPSRYENGTDSPSGSYAPSARAVSNGLAAQSESIENYIGATDFLWQWGQFLDHDITATPVIAPAEKFDIIIPTGDISFDPFNTGTVTMPLDRSFYNVVDGVRQQVNEISAYIDASNVYGSDATRALALRRLDGSGKLKTTSSVHGDLLPYNTTGQSNAPANSPNFFLAGDFRANEQVGLTSMHTLFVREHNYHADGYQELNPGADGEETYQYARMIVIAEMQAITYNEFLPVLLGKKPIKRYKKYKPTVNAGITNAFAASAYRFGHSLIPTTMLRLDQYGQEIAAGNLSLSKAFFDPKHIEEEGIDSVLRGLATQQCEELDGKIVDDLRNLLFGPPGAGGMDLAALNIQRGRDHGLPTYNEARRALRIRPARSFRSITRDPAVIEQLENVYGDVSNVELWVGCLCETHRRRTMTGKVLDRLLTDQFTRLRDGDRFWYQRYLSKELQKYVNRQTLATIIRRNTGISGEIQDNVFKVQH